MSDFNPLVTFMTLTLSLVAQMGKNKRWNDVRLLSFDLQTVEFAYTAVRYFSIFNIHMFTGLRGYRTIRCP